MRSLALLLVPALAIACGSPDETSSADSNLDTSGCSGLDFSIQHGPVKVDASRPPTSSCWNVPESGLSLTYTWLQTNDDKPQKNNVGFYTALNGGDTFVKADSYACAPAPAGISLGHDTSGDRTFACTARKRVDFAHAPKLLAAAYDGGGHRLPWSVQVAVALDDAGNWDSLGGKNYQFAF